MVNTRLGLPSPLPCSHAPFTALLLLLLFFNPFFLSSLFLLFTPLYFLQPSLWIQTFLSFLAEVTNFFTFQTFSSRWPPFSLPSLFLYLPPLLPLVVKPCLVLLKISIYRYTGTSKQYVMPLNEHVLGLPWDWKSWRFLRIHRGGDTSTPASSLCSLFGGNRQTKGSSAHMSKNMPNKTFVQSVHWVISILTWTNIQKLLQIRCFGV